MSLRSNVRNYLCGLSQQEVLIELELSLQTGDRLRAQYISEWLEELISENEG